MSQFEQSDDYGSFQEFIDKLFEDKVMVSQLDILVEAEIYDLNKDLIELIDLLPPGTYSRAQLTLQLNASASAQGLGLIHGVVS